MDKVHQLENEIENEIEDEIEDEIIANCVECNAERVMAYWDDELECYIYLCDKEPICNECMSKQGNISQALPSQVSAIA